MARQRGPVGRSAGAARPGLIGHTVTDALFGWVNGLFGISSVRFVHNLVMWVILASMIHHVYSALLVDHWERNGLMASIFSGKKFVTRQEIQETRDGGWDVRGIAE
jgi:Ni/Fe-hydrogenase 1 B-type cytochrome subunit